MCRQAAHGSIRAPLGMSFACELQQIVSAAESTGSTTATRRRAASTALRHLRNFLAATCLELFARTQ